MCIEIVKCVSNYKSKSLICFNMKKQKITQRLKVSQESRYKRKTQSAWEWKCRGEERRGEERERERMNCSAATRTFQAPAIGMGVLRTLSPLAARIGGSSVAVTSPWRSKPFVCLSTATDASEFLSFCILYIYIYTKDEGYVMIVSGFNLFFLLLLRKTLTNLVNPKDLGLNHILA